MQRYQVWLNGSTIIGHVESDDIESANEMAEVVFKDHFGGDVPDGAEWEIFPIYPGYYEEIADMNQRAGFNAQTDF